jgi:hypothetical protein
MARLGMLPPTETAHAHGNTTALPPAAAASSHHTSRAAGHAMNYEFQAQGVLEKKNVESDVYLPDSR